MLPPGVLLEQNVLLPWGTPGQDLLPSWGVPGLRVLPPGVLLGWARSLHEVLHSFLLGCSTGSLYGELQGWARSLRGVLQGRTRSLLGYSWAGCALPPGVLLGWARSLHAVLHLLPPGVLHSLPPWGAPSVRRQMAAHGLPAKRPKGHSIVGREDPPGGPGPSQLPPPHPDSCCGVTAGRARDLHKATHVPSQGLSLRPVTRSNPLGGVGGTG